MIFFITAAAFAQPPRSPEQADLIDRPVSAVHIEGLEEVPEQLVRNNVRIAVGDPYDPDVIVADVARLERLGRFRFVRAEAELQADGTIHVYFLLTEQPLIAEVQVVGNTLISDQELRGAIRLVRGAPRDDFLIAQAKAAIEEQYRQRGHYLASVSLDETELERAGILIFRIVEGPRVRIAAIEFLGNEAFDDRQLHAEIETRTAILLLRRGELDEERLIDDVAALDRFYKDRGYLDVRVDRQIDLSPDMREAKVTFVISEGPVYRLRSIHVERRVDGRPLRVFAPEQIAAMLEIRSGDVYSRDRLRRSIRAIEQAYGRLGYVWGHTEGREFVGARVFPTDLRVGDEPLVDLILEIDEGEPAEAGLVHVQGNFLTRDRVIRRHVRLEPGRPLDATEVDRSTRRIQETRLFNDVRITVLDPQEEAPEVRDVLVEVKERNTGSINFGIAVGSDAGVFGEFSLGQDNFDLFDFPESFGELIRGRAFRGGGQRFSMSVQPGNEIFQYAVSLTEPYFLESDYSLRVSGLFRQRRFRQYDEERLGGSFTLGRRLGDVWTLGLRGRGDHVELSDISPAAPLEILDDAGPDVVTALGLSLTRTTIPLATRPGRGSRFQIAFDRLGAMGGDFHLNSLSSDFTLYMTVDEDFLGRKSTLRLSTEVGYLFDGDAPVYERFFRGGRTFRGFRFREVSPKGTDPDTGEIGNEPIGGTWMLFLGGQYEFPLFGDAVTGVAFVDSGTVTDSPGFDEYRVSAGGGVRLYIPQFGPAPIAFDLGVPIRKQPGDRSQLLSFSIELPF